MTHQEIANNFKQFTYDCINKEVEVKSLLSSLSDDLIYRRVIINKLYYALYHKYLQEDSHMRSLTGPGQHTAILKKLSKLDAALYRIYSKLYNLRVWADYNTNDDGEGSQLNLRQLNYQVHKVVTRATFNIS